MGQASSRGLGSPVVCFSARALHFPSPGEPMLHVIDGGAVTTHPRQAGGLEQGCVRGEQSAAVCGSERARARLQLGRRRMWNAAAAATTYATNTSGVHRCVACTSI